MTRIHRLPALVALTALVAVVAAFGAIRSANAHPLGNFTINHYDRIEVSATGIEVYRILDMAEIPTFQERQRIDTNGDGTVADGETEAWAAAKADDLKTNLHLVVNGAETKLGNVSHGLTYPPGQGGLLLLRLSAAYKAELPDGWRDSSPTVSFSDTNYADRIGWREIVVRGGPGVDITDSTASSQDVSNELLNYPQDALSSPLDVRDARFSFKPGAGSAAVAAPDPDYVRATRGTPDSTLSQYSDLIAKDKLSIGAVALALLAALGFGAIHALSPGHGKTIVAAYLVGSRGTAKHALVLGLTVTATHTSSVYALGFITLYLSAYIVPETLYPWLGIISGGLIVVMGLALFIGRLRSSGLPGEVLTRLRRPALAAAHPQLALAYGEHGAALMTGARGRPESWSAGRPVGRSAGELAEPQTHMRAHEHERGVDTPHPHADDDAGGASSHAHGWGAAHSHAMPGQDGEPVTWQRLVGLGIFGGLLPCPSAIVVMLSAIALHRVGLGLLLIVAFSLGLAGVLTGIGFALVYARTITKRLPLLGRLADAGNRGGVAALALRAFPVASAVAVVGAGLVVTLRALAQQGML